MRWGTRWGTAAIVAAAGAGAAVLLLGRRVSDRWVRPGPVEAEYETLLRVHDLGAGRVAVTRTLETVRPGHYALEWADGGHAVVGEVLGTDVQSVTRRLERADGGTLAVGTEVRFTSRVFLGDPRSALGLDHTDTVVEGELGPMPAWYVPETRGLWVILVHGPNADRRQALPALAVLHSLRLPTLTITYRGDEGAPASPDGLGHFGETEWRDVESALRFALDRGAARVVLYGWSLGATMALQTAARSAWRDRIGGLVLDSAVLDWQATVRRDAARSGLPAALAGLGALAAQGRTKVDLADFDRLADGRDLQVPTLLLHSPDDSIAPWAAAERLAALREDVVGLQAVPGAEHTALWNVDPEAYAEALRRWLTPLM